MFVHDLPHDSFSDVFYSLTASKEAGVTIEIDGKKVALGVPGVQRPITAGQDAEAYPLIPLRRGGTPEDAAGSVLLCVTLDLIHQFRFSDKCGSVWHLL